MSPVSGDDPPDGPRVELPGFTVHNATSVTFNWAVPWFIESDSKEWVERYELLLGDADDNDRLLRTVIVSSASTLESDRFRYSFSATMNDLTPGTNYSWQVSAVSCGGSRRGNTPWLVGPMLIPPPPPPSPPVYRFNLVQLEFTGINTQSFDAAAVLSSLRTELTKLGTDLQRRDMDLEALVSPTDFTTRMRLAVRLEQQQEAAFRSAVAAAVLPRSSGNCQSPLSLEIAAQTLGAFDAVCVKLAASVSQQSGSDFDASATTPAPSSSASWQEPVVYAMSAVAGALVIGIAVCLIRAFRKRRAQLRKDQKVKIEMGEKLGNASMY